MDCCANALARDIHSIFESLLTLAVHADERKVRYGELAVILSIKGAVGHDVIVQHSRVVDAVEVT